MRRLLLSGLMVLAFSVTAFAGVDVSKLQLPGDITQAQADTVIKGALAKAKEQGVPMNIAVVDAGGNLKAFTRMDGAFLGSIDISIGISGRDVADCTETFHHHLYAHSTCKVWCGAGE